MIAHYPVITIKMFMAKANDVPSIKKKSYLDITESLSNLNTYGWWWVWSYDILGCIF